ncbi:class I adenylate-forming enzyme family protein [Anaeromyxobacter sp. Red801]|uniref:class I adenylate-forming enzyme family protein n=1 Tax=Anaeromyxobacter sp. Red801 TaxID=3411632 RepID=UPI003BA2A478
MKTAAQDQACRDRAARLPENIADRVAEHARRAPGAVALLEHNTGETVTWKQLDTAADAFAARLLAAGYRKGDVVATSLPLLKEHVFLLVACYRVGVILAPLDLRLRAGELRAAFEKLRPRGYFFVGAPALLPVLQEVVGKFPGVRDWVQFQKEPDGILPGATWVKDFTRRIKLDYLKAKLLGTVRRARARVGKRDGCLIIFTTGSTGSPKPALLCHESILVQNVGLTVGFDLREDDRLLVNLPPSHVGCTTELLGTALYEGITSVLLHVFDALKSLEAIAEHRVTVVGQIPALFNAEWSHRRYAELDLSSLRAAIYGGQGVPRAFLDRLRTMAPEIGTGLGLTETSGFCTYTAVGASADDLAGGIGFESPLCPISIRGPMTADGHAGPVLPAGTVGEICFSGPQVFLGYLNDPAATAQAVTRDGVCYTGDLGSYDPARGLRLAGRAKLVIKPKGFQVFPGDVENHVVSALPGRVAAAACVGVEHARWSEAIVLFVEAAPDATVTPEDVHAACDGIASYARPSHVEVVSTGTLPLNRVAKVDYVVLRERARELVEALRREGKWDARASR